MQAPKLIGITGHIGSGKTTAAHHLISNPNGNWIEKSFADPLKEACKTLFLFTDEQVYGTQAQKKTPDPRWFGCTPRKALQFVGTELLRDNLDKIMPGLGKDVFVHHFKLWLESNTTSNIVIHDMRFLNEAKAIKELGGIVIRINRREADSIDHTHPSEKEIDLIVADHYIANEQDVTYLTDEIDRIVSSTNNLNLKSLETEVNHIISNL